MRKTNKQTKTLVLLDTHAILHRAYHALPDFTSPAGDPTGALYGVVTMVLRIIEEFKPTYIIACYDLPEPTYRHDAFADYKGKRVKTDDALVTQIERSKDLLAAFGIPVLGVPGFEADDLLGTLAEVTKDEVDLQVIIASGDMDTLQCVDNNRVLVYTLKKGIKDTILYNATAVLDRFGFAAKYIPDYKGLRGDTSDNIPGIVGIGEKTATTLIREFHSLEKLYKVIKKDEAKVRALGITPRVLQLLKDGEEEAQFSKMLATIRTDAPVTFSADLADWRRKADVEALLSLFTELGFRSLTGRIQKLFSLTQETSAQIVTDEEVAEVALWLWLIDSDKTNASYEDIIEYGRAYFETTDFSEIAKKLHASVLSVPGLARVLKEIEEPLTPVIQSINKVGIVLDTEYLHQLSLVMHKELQALETGIYEMAGCEFNINSPKQLGEVLFDALGLKPKNPKKTAGGQRSTKESELEKMRDDHPIIALILRYRELQKLTSTYVDALPKLVGQDGRLRTTLLQTGTTTGRIASRDPNLQNIPVRTKESKAIRQAFVAAPGCTLVSIDYSQIELRIAAILSHDMKLVDIFRRGEDVHTGVAVRVFGVHADEVTSEMRRKAKIINFGILYGMGVNALRQNLGADTPRDEAQAFLTAYFQTFTRLAEYLEETKAQATKTGYTETLFGRRRYFPQLRSSQPFVRASGERMAINAPVQGTAADIMRLAMVAVQSYINKTTYAQEVRMILQVHDELLFEIRDDLVEVVVPEIVKLMEGVLAGEETLSVPIKVDVATGSHWGML